MSQSNLPARLWALALALASASAVLAQAPAFSLISDDAGPMAPYVITDDLEHPWGMAELPDGRLLVSERPGRLRLITPADSSKGKKVGGVPDVWAKGQGGLLDVELSPDFATDRFVYLTYAEPGEDGTAGTALGRGRLSEDGDDLRDFEVLWRMEPKVEGPNHFGSRVIFAGDSLMFISTGERFKFDPAQNPDTHLGTVVRLLRDGSVPADNPVLGDARVAPGVYTFGHRNIEAMALDPATGAVWVTEMGPLGGDELNRLEPGANYGWPLVSWGKDYDGTDRPDPPTRPEFEDAAIHWTPTISPSGMTFYSGDMFPEFRGDAFIGGLTAMGLVRVRTTSPGVAEEVERLPLEARTRDVMVGADGSFWVLTDADDGKLIHITELKPGEGG